MKRLAELAIDTAVLNGASYADIRIIYTKREKLEVTTGHVTEMDISENVGFGVRVIANGAWGFASSNNLKVEEIQKTAKLAVQIAKASAMLKKQDVKLAKEPVHNERWQTPYLIDPFQVPMHEKLGLMHQIDDILRRDSQIKRTSVSMDFLMEHQWLATSEGTFIDQKLMRSGVGYSATAVGNNDMQIRSYPNSFRGQYMTMGYELIHGIPLVENAERVREEAIALLTAKECPEGTKDIILDGTQMALQIHESVGHATELDRVLGMEANYAGMSFATLEKLNNFRYGSDVVNLVCDSTVPNGLATIGYDDDGVRAKRYHLVKDGDFVGYQFNRELAHTIEAEESSGNNRAHGWSNIPIVRITNLSLMPGEWEFDDLVSDTEDGIYMETNKCWSIDQWRLNFEFGTEIGWEIKNGKKGEMLKNCSYQSITPKFWGSCDAICNDNYWTLWGVSNCGKGQPGQTAEMSHGASPTRFRNINVGIGNSTLK
ncbi:MAG: TldD/PmbA family protein [Calditrichaeota bacterium]|nr:MAG: TldD/PmbA family protein [Calditrichota bacterium]